MAKLAAHELPPELLRLLPNSMRELAEAIGLEATLKLVQLYGGRRTPYIPRNMTEDHPFAVALGLDAARALSTTFGGAEYLDIRLCAAAAAEIRARMMQAEAERGRSLNELAEKYQVCRRRVEQQLRGRPHSRQTEMEL